MPARAGGTGSISLKPMEELRREGEAAVWGSWGGNTPLQPFGASSVLSHGAGQQGEGFGGHNLSPMAAGGSPLSG